MANRILFILAMLSPAVWAVDVPNLNVVLPHVKETRLPNRAKRIHALEKANRQAELSQKDELEQDLIYLRDYQKMEAKSIAKTIAWHPRAYDPQQKSILFFDLNFGPSEIRAAEQAARARGENLLVYPERSPQQQIDIENQYRQTMLDQQKYFNCIKDVSNDCGALQTKLKSDDVQLRALTSAINRLDRSNIDAVVADLAQRGVRLSTIVFSGHSGGTGFFEGLFGELTSDDVNQSFAKFPAPLSTVTSILLWGCYSGTLDSFTTYWQTKFPSVAAFVGYRERAPLGIRDSSGQFLKSYLVNERKFLAAKSMPAAHKIFRSIADVSEIDGAAVRGPSYFTYDQVGNIQDLMKICEQFDAHLLDQYHCYQSGAAGCENPPEDHQGPLRTLYTYLRVNQHCEAALQEKFRGIPTPDIVVRLIFVDAVKENFSKFHASEFQSFGDYAKEIGVAPEVRFENFMHSKRSQDFNYISLFKADEGRLGIRDMSYLDLPNWRSYSKVEDSFLGLSEVLGFLYRRMDPCVPLSWIEPDSKDIDTCEVSGYLIRPPSVGLEHRLLVEHYQALLTRYGLDRNPSMDYFYWFTPAILPEIKKYYLNILQQFYDNLSRISSRTAIEENRFTLYGKLLAQGNQASDAQIRGIVLGALQNTIVYLDQLIKDASAVPNGEQAVANLKSTQDRIVAFVKVLQ